MMSLLVSIITPSFGLLFWMLVGFAILFFILAKYAWPFITKTIRQREKHIEEQLNAANKVREDMAQLKSEHQVMLEKAKNERDAILADARKIRDKMYEEAKEKANAEANEIIADAKKTIHFEKMKAVTDIKNEIANLSIDIAEKILRNELSNESKQEELIEQWMKEVHLN